MRAHFEKLNSSHNQISFWNNSLKPRRTPLARSMELLQVILVFFCLLFPCILSTKPCTNIPPFLNRLRDGVDITKLDLLPIDASGNDGFRYPVMDFTCNEKKVKKVNGVRSHFIFTHWIERMNLFFSFHGFYGSSFKFNTTRHHIGTRWVICTCN